MKRVKLLPENLINQIAAGEVIERPASVVKELVENSIDAGATRIEVEVSNACRDIRIADNGHGIHRDDVVLAFSRHATSKIQNQKDLINVSTLGFRGEALASIISVAKVTCITRTTDSDSGIKVDCENSEIQISETGCAVGTIMDIRELFYNIPARLKFLKKVQTELSVISETLQNLALSHPGVAVNLIHKKNSILKTTGSGDLATTVSEIYTKSLINDLNRVDKQDEQFGLYVKGFTSSPDYTRSNKKGIYVFINGRMIRCPIISKSIDTAYKDMIPTGRYPFAILDLKVPNSEVDINVHPSKKEVKYTKPNLIFNFIRFAIRTSLESGATSFENRNNAVHNPESLPFREQTQEVAFERQVSPSLNNEPSELIDFSSFAARNNEISEDDIQEVIFPEPHQNKIELGLNQPRENQAPVSVIGQLNSTYILLQAEDGLQIVDQHIAHERYLYEKLKDGKSNESQFLLATQTIELEQEQLELLRENLGLLEKFGYEFEFVQDYDNSGKYSNNAVALQAPVDDKIKLEFGSGVRLKRAPAMVSQKNPEEIIIELVDSFHASPEKIEDEIIIRTACRAAVKAGEELSIRQMDELIKNWQTTRFPKTCPHGRKISHTIPTKDVAKFFGRVE